MSGFGVKVRDVLRHGLLLQTGLDGLARVGIEITPFRLYAESLDSLPDGVARDAPPGIELRPLAPGDAAAVAAMPESDTGEDEARERLLHGIVAVGAWSGNQLVACSWADLEQLDYEPCRRSLAPDEAYLFGARTARSSRGMDLGPAVRIALYEHLADMGRTRLLSVSYALHRPANRFKEKLGATIEERHVHVSLAGRWQRDWRVGGGP